MLFELAPGHEFAKGLRDAEFVSDFLEQSFVLLAEVGVERAGFFPAGRVPKFFDREEFLALETLPQEPCVGAWV